MSGMKHKRNPMIGEVSLDYLVYLHSRLCQVDPDYQIFYYSGRFKITNGRKGRPVVTGSINRLVDYVERITGLKEVV